MNSEKEIADQLALFSAYLKQNGLKMTRQRALVVESFLQSGGHVSTEELYNSVRKRDSRVGFTTVFRTLKALTLCGLAREADLLDGRARFEPLYNRPHHHHIVCAQCNRTIEFLSPELERLQEQVVSRYGFKSRSHQLQIFGTCQDCQNQRPSSSEVFDNDLIFARDALRIAMETEKSGVNFYLHLGESLTRASGKSTFSKILEEEKKHLRELEKEWEQLISKHPNLTNAPVFLHFDYDALKRIFPAREDLKTRIENDIDEESALRLAMEMEKESYNFFKAYAESFNDTKGKAIFRKFAEEELEHYRSIEQEHQKLMGSPTQSREVD
ncbi:MAG TPA: transcriptional repressor [Terriglobia bacterium]|nr:transcriptional repressor [Terriglobia bacterium]